MKKDGAMGEARRAWKKAHPGFTGAIHDLIERSFDAGWEAALAQCPTCNGSRVAPVDRDLGGVGVTMSSCPDCAQGEKE